MNSQNVLEETKQCYNTFYLPFTTTNLTFKQLEFALVLHVKCKIYETT